MVTTILLIANACHKWFTKTLPPLWSTSVAIIIRLTDIQETCQQERYWINEYKFVFLHLTVVQINN